MGKHYHLKVYQDIIGENLYETEFNPVRRVMQLEKKIRGLEILLDGATFGNIECPAEIGLWIDKSIYYPIKSGSLTLSELLDLSNNETDLGAYSLKLYIREVIQKRGEILDNYTHDFKKRNLKI